MLLPKDCTEQAGEYTHEGTSVSLKPNTEWSHVSPAFLYCCWKPLPKNKDRGGEKGREREKSWSAFLTGTWFLVGRKFFLFFPRLCELVLASSLCLQQWATCTVDKPCKSQLTICYVKANLQPNRRTEENSIEEKSGIGSEDLEGTFLLHRLWSQPLQWKWQLAWAVKPGFKEGRTRQTGQMLLLGGEAAARWDGSS